MKVRLVRSYATDGMSLHIPRKVMNVLGWDSGDTLTLDIWPAYKGNDGDSLIIYKESPNVASKG